MRKEILLATNNQGKVNRYRMLAKEIDSSIVLHTLKDLNIDSLDINEDGSLEENARKKAQAYSKKTSFPVLANDAGFFVKGKGLIKNPKRIALNSSEENLTKEEIYQLVLDYWREVAKESGGEVDAAWVDAFAIHMPSGNFYKEGAKREVLLVNKVLGEPHIQFPLRAIYISKATNKPAALHTKEEELLEVKPIQEALSKLFKKIGF